MRTSKTTRKATRFPALFCGVAFALSPSSAWSGWFAERSVSYLSGGDTRPCAFFTLSGVDEAVAAVPGSGWFVLPKTHPQYKETFAILLSAKLAGRVVNVTTTDNVHACGHAEVVSVGMP